MPYAEIDGVPLWYEEHGDPDGPPLVALHGGVLTFELSFGDVLPWLAAGRRVIGVELQGHGHTPDTGRAMSIDRFADDVAELLDVLAVDRADVWGFSLGGLTATALAIRHPSRVGRLVLAAVHVRPDGYHPEITAPSQDDPRLPTEEEFATWQAAYEAVAPEPGDFFPFLERLQPVVHGWAGWTDDQVRSVAAPVLLVLGDRDFVRLDHAAEMLDLFPSCRLAVLPGTKHTEVMQRSAVLRPLVEEFLGDGGLGGLGAGLELFAELHVRDYATARPWYVQLLGEPAFRAHDTEEVWQLAPQRSLAVQEEAAHAGHGAVTAFVEDLDAVVAAIQGRGLEPAARETYGNGVRKVVFRDPDGNEVGFGGAPLPEGAG